MSALAKEVCLVEDEAHVRRAIAQTLELAGYTVLTCASAPAALTKLTRDWRGTVISDVKMPTMDGLELLQAVLRIDPDIPVVLITGHGDIAMAVQAMRKGAYDFLEKPFRNEDLLDILERAQEKRALVLENRALRAALDEQDDEELIGASPPMLDLRRRIASVASTDADVLVFGETGTGKELVARSLHRHSARRERPFVAINCGAIPETMIESELFGHEAGSFTDARRRRVGKFEHANGGTVFLDEIESMPLSLGVRLLRVLQERVLERLGSNDPVPLDIRIVAATKADLKQLAAEGRFREDLYYRLNVVELVLPPLRERREDIPLLFEHFAALASERYARAVPAMDPALMAQLMSRDWPGNVRELRNAADRLVLDGAAAPPTVEPGTTQDSLPLPQRLELFERLLIKQALAQHKGNVKDTYQALGIARKTFYDKLAKYNLDRKDYQ